MPTPSKSHFSFMEKLEERVLFDAVPDGSFVAPPTESNEPLVVQHQTAQSQQADDLIRELILIDAGVVDGRDLLRTIISANTERTFEVHYLEPERDGIDQISEILGNYGEAPYGAVHIISHGEAGRVQLGNDFLDSNSLQNNTAEIAAWGNSLTDDADLLFYGCELASSAEGRALTSSIAQLTGADVAASDDLTGHASQGADWVLEHQVGEIQAKAFEVRSYSGTLATATDDTNSIQADTTGTASGNVLSNDSHSSGTITEVHAYSAEVGNAFQLNYGQITMNADGSYAYDIDENHAAVIGLRVGEVMEEIVSYEVTDSGSSDTGILVITIIGVEDELVAADDFDDVTTVTENVATGNIITDTGVGLDIFDRGLSQLIWEDEYLDGATVNGTNRTVDGITVGITTTDPDGAGSSSNHTVSHTTNGGHFGYLRHNLLGSIDPNSEVSTTFTFSEDVFSLSFILADIDRDQTDPVSWQDQFHVVGTLGGVEVDFSALVAGTVTEMPNDTFYGDGSVPPSEAHGNVNIVFNGSVDSVTITYKYGPSLATTPTGILGAVSDLSWQPPIDVFVSEVNADPALVGVPYVGTYGTFLINSDGSYTYTLDDTNPDVIALGSAETLTDQIAYTLENTIAQVSSATVTMTIHGINEPPTLDIDLSGSGTGYSNGFTEAAGTVNLADIDVQITDIDNPDTGMESLTITPGGLSDGADEILIFNGDSGATISFAMNTGQPSQVITFNGIDLLVSFDGTSFLVVNNAGGDIPNADLRSFISGITYNNTDPGLTAGPRTFDFVVNDGEDDSNVSTSTINVATDPDAAQWSLTGDTNVDEGGTASYVLAISGPLRNGETALIDIALTNIETNSSDYLALTTAINAAIAANPGPGSFSWDGTTLTFTSDGTGTMTPLDIDITAVNDFFAEGPENFTLALSSPASTTGETISLSGTDYTVTTTIADTQGVGGPSDGTGEWSISGPVTGDEGQTLQYSIGLSGSYGIGEIISVEIGLTDIDTNSNDYANLITAISAAAATDPTISYNSSTGILSYTSPTDGGTMSPLNINLLLNDEGYIEGPEDFSIGLTNASSPTSAGVSIGSNDSVTTTINDTQGIGGPADGPGSWSISGPASTDEGGTAQYTISLSGQFGLGQTATVDIDISNITTNNSDYANFVAAVTAAAALNPNVSFNSATGTLTFTPSTDGGTMSDLILNVGVTNDTLIEGPESYSISLTNPNSTTGANVSLNNASVSTTISDTQSDGGAIEGPGEWAITGPSNSDEGTAAQFTVSLSGNYGIGEMVSVEIAFSDLDTSTADHSDAIAAIAAAATANSNVTFNSLTGILTFTSPSEGATMSDLLINLTITDDSLVEGPEDLRFSLSNPTSSTGANVSISATNGSAVTTINDTQGSGGAADTATWSVTGSSSVDEGGTATYVVALDQVLQNGETATVELTLSDLETTIADHASFITAVQTAVGLRSDLSFNSGTGVLTYTGDGTAMADLTIDLNATDDTLVEGPERFQILLANGGSTTGSTVSVDSMANSVTTTIEDTVGDGGANEEVIWSFGADQTTQEGDTATYALSLTNGILANGERVTVDISLTNIDTDSSDYANFDTAVLAAVAAYSGPGTLSYNSVTGTIEFIGDGNAMTPLSIDLASIDDIIAEGPEDYRVEITNPNSSTGASVSIDPDNDDSLTTIDDTSGGGTDTVTWSIDGAASVDEGGTASYTIQLTGVLASGQRAHVELALANIETTSADYAVLASAVQTAVGSRSDLSFNSSTGILTYTGDGASMADLIVNLSIVDDTEIEGTERYMIDVTNEGSLDGVSVGIDSLMNSVITSINDTIGDGGPPEAATWSITGSPSVNEGDAIAFTISLGSTIQNSDTATVDLSLANLETSSNDYDVFVTAVQNAVAAYSGSGAYSFDSMTGKLTFTSDGNAAGDLDISLGTVDDNNNEGSERLRVSLSNPGSTTGVNSILGTPSLVTTTIVDDETSQWSISGTTNGDEGETLTYTIILSGEYGAGEIVSVDVELTDIATNPGDYSDLITAINTAVAANPDVTFDSVSGTLTYTAPTDGSSMTPIVVNLLLTDDSFIEGQENFTLSLTNALMPTGVSVTVDSANSAVQTTINDTQGIGGTNDGPGQWSLAGTTSADEGETANYIIALSGVFGEGEIITVDLGLIADETNSTDYADFLAAVSLAVAGNPDVTFNSTTGVLTYTSPADGGSMADLSIDLGIVNDDLIEGDENFSLSLSNAASPTSANVQIDSSANRVTTTIRDTQGIGGTYDGPANWSIAGPATADEGESVTYTISLSGSFGIGEVVTVDLDLNDMTTTAADYGNVIAAIQAAASANPNVTFDSSSGTLTYTAPNDNSSMTDLSITFTISNDNNIEGTESFRLVLANANSTTGVSAGIGSASVTTTINDTQGVAGPVDGPGEWSISGPADVDEGATAQFTINLSGNYGQGEVVTVDLMFNAGSTNSSDYENIVAAVNAAVIAAPNVTFNPGTGTLTYTAPSDGASMPSILVDLDIINDAHVEGTETFGWELNNAASATGANVSVDSLASTTSTTINDTQGIGGLGDGPANWNISGPIGADEGESVQFTVSLSGTYGAGEIVSVEIDLSENSTNASDYSDIQTAIAAAAASNTNVTYNSSTDMLTFTSPSDGANMTDLVINVDISNDANIEGPENFSLVLSNAASTTGINPGITNASVSTTIEDTQGVGGANDGPGTWSILGSSVVDEGGTSTYSIALSGTYGAGEIVTVDIDLAAIETNSNDYADVMAAIATAAATDPTLSFSTATGRLTYTSPSDGSTMTPILINLGIINDNLIEGSESFTVNLSNASSTTGANTTISSVNNSVSTTIADTQGIGGVDDGPAEWNITGPVAGDEGGSAQYIISLSGLFGAGESVAIDVDLNAITTNGSDYNSAIAAFQAAAAANPNVTFDTSTGTLTYTSTGDGEAMADLVVNLTLIDDALIEGPESYTIDLTNPASTTGITATVGTSSVATVINDTQGIGGAADGPGEWSITGAATVGEGDTAQFTIALSGTYGAAETASVDIDLIAMETDGSDLTGLIAAINAAIASDPSLAFNSSTGTLTFTASADGASMSDLVIDLDTLADGLTEGNEDFAVSLTNPGSTTGADVAIATGSETALTNIIDADGSNWSITGPSTVDEGETAQFTIELGGGFPSGTIVTVDIQLVDSDTNSNDYGDILAAISTATSLNPDVSFDTTSGTLTYIAPSDGASMADLVINLTINDDAIVEGPEDFVIRLASATSTTGTNVGISPTESSVTATIIDTQGVAGLPDSLDWSISGSSNVEEGGYATYILSLEGLGQNGESVSVVLGIGDIDTTPVDYSSLAEAIQLAIIGRSDLSFDSTTGTLTYNADGNSMENLTFTIPATSDQSQEAPESYQVSLTSPTSSTGAASTIVAGKDLVTTTIDSRETATGDTPPIATDDSATTHVGQTVNGNLISNDGDPDGDVIAATTIPISGPDNGTVTINADGSFSYQPDAGFRGLDRFEYEVTDAQGNTDTATVTVQVKPDTNGTANDSPIANDDGGIGQKNGTISGDLLANDSDPNADSLSINQTPIAAPTNGSVIINADGTYTYTPVNDYVGNDSFVYEVCDSSGACQIAIVHIVVFDNPPNAFDDINNTIVETPVSGNVLTNDSDPNANDVLTVSTTPVAGPTNGTVILNADGTYQYTPDAGFTGQDAFEYEVCDEAGNCSTAIVRIEIRNTTPGVAFANSPPIAHNDAITTFVDTEINGDLLGNDGDPDNDLITVDTTPTAYPNNGNVTIFQDGSFTYTPHPGFTGTDWFMYTINDPSGSSDTATVTISIIPDANGVANNSPFATDNAGIGQKNEPIAGSLIANDVDPNGDSLTINTTPLAGPDSGTLVINPDGTYVYTPGNDFVGNDSFIYEICDTSGACDQATVVLTVFDAQPVAQDDIANTIVNEPVSGNVLDNDLSNNVGDNLTVNPVPFSQPENGTVSLLPDGSFLFTPNPGFVGNDSFEYEVCDENGNCDIGHVDIEIRDTSVFGNNPAPIANDDVATTFQGNPITTSLISNDGHPLGNTVSVNLTPVTSTSNGFLTIHPDGTFTYTPDPNFVGSDSFEYEILDAQGESDTAIVTIEVNPDNNGASNDPPTGGEDALIGQKNKPLLGNLLANDSDPNGDPLTINTTPVSPATNGVLTINSDGTFTYVPNPDFTGSDTFEYEVCDGQGGCTIVTGIVTIFNEPPIAMEDTFEVLGDTISADTSTNDFDPNGDSTIATIVTPPRHGTIVWNPTGTFTYIPGPNYVGVDSFTYIICDDDGACGTATVNLVTPFAFDSFNNPATDENSFKRQDEPLNNRNRQLLLSKQIGNLAPEPILAGYAQPGSTLIGRVYDEHGSLVAESTTQVNRAGNWILHFFDVTVQTHYTVMIEHISTETVAKGDHHFRLTPETYRALQLGANHTQSSSIGNILSDTPANSLETWHRQNINPLRLL